MKPNSDIWNKGVFSNLPFLTHLGLISGWFLLLSSAGCHKMQLQVTWLSARGKQACSSHLQMVVWICFWFLYVKLKYEKNSEDVMLSRFWLLCRLPRDAITGHLPAGWGLPKSWVSGLNQAPSIQTGNISRCTKQSLTNIFEYLNIWIFLIRIFIRIFVRIIFWIWIYSDICSCQLFGYEYIRIFVRTNFQDTNRFWRCFYLKVLFQKCYFSVFV